MLRRIVLVLLAVSVVATTAQAQSATSPVPSAIVTRGQASLKRAPDQAWVAIAAEARAATPTEAQRQGAEAMAAVQAALAKSAIPAEAIRTTGYSLQPDMEYVNGRGRVRGYIVHNELEVRVDNLERVGAVLDAAGVSGATSMSGLRFDLKDRATAEREALRLAVQDAMARARAIAAGAGATLGPILRIDETGEGPTPVPYPTMRMAQASPAPPTPVSPGEIEIGAQVTLTIAIR
jgi:uncharacterized protein YggE